MMNKFQPDRFENRRAMLLAGLRQQHSFETASETIPKQWQQFQILGTLTGQVGKITYGAVCGATSGGFEYMSGTEVESFTGLAERMGRMRIPEQYYAVFLHRDYISAIQNTWERIFSDWLPSADVKPVESPCFELYDERFSPESGMGIVEIYFPIEQKSSKLKQKMV
jgi:AraC family transcriptional regulator